MCIYMYHPFTINTHTSNQPKQLGVAVSCLRALLHPTSSSSHTTTKTRRPQQEGPADSAALGMGLYGVEVEDEGAAALLAMLLYRLDFWCGGQKTMTTRA